MKQEKRHSVEMAKRGAYLHTKHNKRRAQVIPNKKRKASRNFCRGN